MKWQCKTPHSDVEQGKVVPFLKAISDEHRLKIVCFLKQGEQCVCDIVVFLDLPQNLVSHHLKVLRENNLVSFRKEGLRVFYTLNDDMISEIMTFLSSLLQK